MATTKTPMLMVAQEMMTRGDQLQLLKSYSRYVKLCKSGFPANDARFMTGLNDDDVFKKAGEIYKSYL